MTRLLFLAAGLVGLLLIAAAPNASAATPDEIKRAIKGGTDALKAKFGSNAPAPQGGGENQILGGTCLTGLALLEAGIPVNDPVVKAITGNIRDSAYKQDSTYQIALCLMFLDRLGDVADEPIVQMLGVRLLVGQLASGGWSYQCIAPVSADDERWLRTVKADHPAGKLHPAVEKYHQALKAARGAQVPNDDNSNTQFAVLAVWLARKRGVPVEDALDLIEKRFSGSQDGASGNWPYQGGQTIVGSPSMYCAGLLGMATAIARREERRVKQDPPPKPAAKPDPKAGDPFYNPPAGTAPPPKQPARQADARDQIVQRAFAGLGLTFADQMRGKGVLYNGTVHGYGDLYFLWSMERVGVVYGVDKIGGIDWYAVGSTAIVRSQLQNGMWDISNYSAEVNTSFAVLFLCKSNLARDLSSKVQKDPTSTEMRAGAGPSAADLLPNRPVTPAAPPVPVINLPNPTGDEAITRASALLKAPTGDWAKLLTEARDGKGPTYTRALVVTAANTAGDRKKEVRAALAERLCRMTADTLRGMLKANEAELRRAAALACAMKDDKGHVPDLIDALADADDAVVRAAAAGLKSLTGKDFGPAAGATVGQKALALSAWRDWYAEEKK